MVEKKIRPEIIIEVRAIHFRRSTRNRLTQSFCMGERERTIQPNIEMFLAIFRFINYRREKSQRTE